MVSKTSEEGNWEDVGVIGGGKKACSYEVQEFEEEVYGSMARLIVVRSSAGLERYTRKIGK